MKNKPYQKIFKETMVDFETKDKIRSIASYLYKIKDKVFKNIYIEDIEYDFDPKTDQLILMFTPEIDKRMERFVSNSIIQYFEDNGISLSFNRYERVVVDAGTFGTDLYFNINVERYY